MPLRTRVWVCECARVCPHHIDEIGQDALHLVNVHILHLHHPQRHQEGVQWQLVGPEQQVPADRGPQRVRRAKCSQEKLDDILCFHVCIPKKRRSQHVQYKKDSRGQNSRIHHMTTRGCY